MNKMKYLLYLVLTVGFVFAGCKSVDSDIQSVIQKDVWEDGIVSEEYIDFYEDASLTIEEVDTQANTATVTVKIPDLEQYLLNPYASEGNSQILELEFPVQQVDDEWQITSIEPLKEYIRKESTRILLEMMEDSGGIVIDFDPQEVEE